MLTVEWLRGETSVHFLSFSLSPIRRRALESGDETLEIEMSYVLCDGYICVRERYMSADC